MAHHSEKKEVEENMALLQSCKPTVLSSMTRSIRCEKVSDDAEIPAGSTLVYFIRHGEGTHNKAQREWRENPEWDGKSEPYTIDTDPEYGYVDAELNETGKGQVASLLAICCYLTFTFSRHNIESRH